MAEFTVYPAIDLRRGRVVRLRRGDAKAEIFSVDDPVSIAARWEKEGATWLHVVNLDAAFDEAEEVNLRALAQIRAAVKIPIQFGGGLRSRVAIECAFESGAQRVILGTMAVEQPDVVAEAVREFGADRIALAIDLEADRVATHGWRERAAVNAGTFAKQMRELGIERAVVTDITRDGMLGGLDATHIGRHARESGMRVIASGGVASIQDIRACAAYKRDGIEGVIVGTALYTGAVTLQEIALVLRETSEQG